MTFTKTGLLTSVLRRRASFPTRFFKNRDGVAAIEFALIAPVMIAFYFGLSEISLGIGADRQVTHATSVAGDLATQATNLEKTDIEDVMTATVAVLGVHSSRLSRVTIELNSYKMNADGTIDRVGYARVGPAISAGGSATFDPSTLSTNMLNSTSGVVVARVNYQYKPATLAFMQNVTLAETFLLKPRKSLSVPFGDGSTTDFTCTANSDYSVSC